MGELGRAVEAIVVGLIAGIVYMYLDPSVAITGIVTFLYLKSYQDQNS